MEFWGQLSNSGIINIVRINVASFPTDLLFRSIHYVHDAIKVLTFCTKIMDQIEKDNLKTVYTVWWAGTHKLTVLQPTQDFLHKTV